MRATFALLFDHEVHNLVRKLAVEVHQKYRVGLGGSQLPPHVSLKQPFRITDLPAVEAYFDQLAASLEPVVLTFTHIGGPGDAPVLWLEMDESEALRELHTRINQELAERFPNTDAAFDGDVYHFHLTIALGDLSDSAYAYQRIATELASRKVALRTVARHLVLIYYDAEPISPGSFLTYKILPLGKTSVGPNSSHHGDTTQFR